MPIPTTQSHGYLATSSKDNIRDGKKAVEYARKASELTKWNDATALDALAAACAEAAKFSRRDQMGAEGFIISRISEELRRPGPTAIEPLFATQAVSRKMTSTIVDPSTLAINLPQLSRITVRGADGTIKTYQPRIVVSPRSG